MTLLVLPAMTNAEVISEPCDPVVEKNIKWQVIRVRPHTNDLQTCTLSQDRFQMLLHDALYGFDSGQVEFKSLFLGRIIRYPWISDYLVNKSVQSDRWDGEKGQPVSGDLNSYVRYILSMPELLQLVQSPLDGTGYRVVGVSVEKVLISNTDEIGWENSERSVKVPYDALLHFIIKKAGS